MLITGETLLVPGTPGIVYDVKLGDTVTDIAATYGIDPAAIVSFAPNGLESADMIVEGSALVLPGGVPPPPPPPVVVEDARPCRTDPATPEPPPSAPPPGAAAPAPARTTPAAAGRGQRGLHLAGQRPAEQPLRAALGQLPFAGSTSAPATAPASRPRPQGRSSSPRYSGYGYGNYIIVRHGDGSETLYAHLSSIWVSLGNTWGRARSSGPSAARVGARGRTCTSR